MTTALRIVAAPGAPLVRDVFAGSLARHNGPIREEPLFENDNPRLVVSGECSVRRHD